MTQKETRQFGAEVGKILQLMINSLYTNKDIFLRELISNASDACDKLRYLALTTPALVTEDSELGITLSIDKTARTLTITDNGIGMNREELIENLGTIARSGTQAFSEAVQKGDMQLIGQFGVGFYSAFMVADNVSVISRKAGETQSWAWQSNGTGEFTISEAETLTPRGTSITLHLREGEDDYIDKHHIKFVVNTYSDHIGIPIRYNDPELEKAIVLNSASALWTKPKTDITDEQYQQFYKHVAHQADTPWAIMHNKVEGALEYTNLLFIPTMKPFDLFHPDRKTRVKLYVKRVFITEENIDLVPSYLRFIRGIVDSEDLPLNISRETLQHNAMLDKIRKSIVKRVLSTLKERASANPIEYETFWNNFGAVLKEGLCEAMENKEAILEVCRFYSSRHPNQLISLDDYIARMPEGQNTIYYLIGDSIDSLMKSPQLEGFLKRDIEVVLMTEPVDDFWVNVAPEYKGKELKSVTRAGIELDDVKEEEVKPEENTSNMDILIAQMKITLGSVVADVRTSRKLTESPACLAVKEGAMDMRMERFLLDQKQLPSASAKIFEINAQHPVIQKLAQDSKAPTVEDTIWLLYDQACILEGQPIQNPGAFSERLNGVLKKALVA